MTRVAAIGLDATEWTVAQRLMAEGKLPNLASLCDRSAKAQLRNVVPYRSEQVWTQFLTGKRSTDISYYSTETFDPATYASWCQGAFLGDPFYADSSLKTIAFDLPHSSLSRKVEGLQVTAWGAHGPQYPRASLPSGLVTQLDERFGAHPAFDNDFDLGWFDDNYINSLTDALHVGARGRVAASMWLQEQLPDWELFITSMSEIHSAGHHFWHGVDPSHPLHVHASAPLAGRRFEEVATTVDAELGRLVDSLPEDTVLMVFALHGMLPADDLPSMVLLPELLHRRHFGKALLKPGIDPAEWRKAGYPFVIPESKDAWAVMTWLRSHFDGTPRERIRNAVRRQAPTGLLEWARQRTGRPAAYPLGELREPIPAETWATPEEIAANSGARKEIDWQPAYWYRPYWSQMPFFALPTFTDAHIRINLKGRERDGIVEREDYEKACDEAVRVLHQIRNPRTGEPVIADVLRVRAEDPMDPDGPDSDLLIVWSEALDSIAHPDVGIVGPVPFMRTGAHTSNGFLMVSGAQIDPVDLGVREATDLPPTILDLLGQKPPTGMVGESLAAEIRSAALS